jgi:hypothetical protein
MCLRRETPRALASDVNVCRDDCPPSYRGSLAHSAETGSWTADAPATVGEVVEHRDVFGELDRIDHREVHAER